MGFSPGGKAMNDIRTWTELNEQTQKDLLEWRNLSKPTMKDKAALAKLFSDGRFEAWFCLGCGTRVYDGDPKDWREFPGVMQLDYVSYPGDRDKYDDEFLRRLCDTCRCYGPSPKNKRE
jgi:hypothetical protein